MRTPKTILVVGTFDTKRDELEFIQDLIVREGGQVLSMDVSVLGDTDMPVAISKHEVAIAAGVTIADVIAAGDENDAMALMSQGAQALAVKLCAEGRIDGMISLGGTMGTDLALDVALALPLGLPKYIISTVAFSPLIPAERLAADVQMILWAGGLYGLNAICRSALSQAAGAVLGAARTATGFASDRPLIGVSSLGNACLKYMKRLKPALEARGYEVAFFHAQGMGGRALESLASQGHLVAVFDLCLQEFNNGIHGSIVNSGPERLERVGLAGVPQIVAPGAADLVDLPTWQPIPAHFQGRPYHVHNKLITSLTLTPDERRFTAREMAARLNKSIGPTHVILPLAGIEEWDREGEIGHDPESLAIFFAELRAYLKSPVEWTETAAHINDAEFVDAVLKVFDGWVETGLVQPGRCDGEVRRAQHGVMASAG
ncbi:Tm-1-like ATP-binding domain-containing protein [Rhizobium sp. KVB221]|uniref:Tm-1-like ATP-binding domain-containing protein n=1 Tax=Rhizobium setariae TaxID=2801340 RepID=A0A936YSY0_9HYPH|nr:Tm-1-like ATP-binding domain-containing protein [Rhizobium setariae]MBL0374231.1 Tm-1-like ATP-binding domain-containing protein [Rhizobium setariae]